jgi:DNA polymerase-3 subunit epsilon
MKILGLETGPGSCFGLQVGRCRGACVGKEPLPLHDARLRLALASLRLRAWPFKGAVGIRERDADGPGTLLHVVDRWQHLGTARNDTEVAEMLQYAGERPFDPDSYRIVARCLERLHARDLVMLDRAVR